ncbi:hypothetical protein BC941DRAFT_408387 [Chlamydoabsidia padenii]|nr:hypothetical protein BC941DRAFT_408387 [Chlamydoabsidia padenii]
MASSLSFQIRQQETKLDDMAATNFPSPPNSSCGEDSRTFTTTSPCLPPTVMDYTNNNHTPPPPPQRRDSLPSHFSTLTLQTLSHSLPENYTIDHSTIKSALQKAEDKPSYRRTSVTTLSPPVIAAATGGLTIRHHRRHSKQQATSLPSTDYHRCQDCGKVYKHPSYLTKHRWEHSEEWELTSKLLLTKHQQVQLLEAAAILVGMDQRETSLQSSEEKEDEWADIVNDDNDNDDQDDESIHVDIDDDDDNDDDISIEMDQDEPMDQEHTFPSMAGSTPTMLPSSFSIEMD